MLVFDGGPGNQHHYFISTSAQSFTAMCVGTFQSSERMVDFKVNKCGLQGTYQVSLIVDDTMYPMNLTLTVEE